MAVGLSFSVKDEQGGCRERSTQLSATPFEISDFIRSRFVFRRQIRIKHVG